MKIYLLLLIFYNLEV